MNKDAKADKPAAISAFFLENPAEQACNNDVPD